MRKVKDKWRLKGSALLEPALLDSEAFNQLSASAIKTLLRFLRKRTYSIIKKKIIYNKEIFSLTYEEARDALGISAAQHLSNLKKLMALGFIDMAHQGGCYGKDFSRYSVSERWRAFGTNEFRQCEKKRALRQGGDVRSNMKRKEKRERAIE